LVRVIDEIPHRDIGGSTPSQFDEAITITQVPERTVVAKRRFGLGTALIAVAGIAAVAGYIGYSGLPSSTPDKVSLSQPVPKSSEAATGTASLQPAAPVKPEKPVAKPNLPRAALSESQTKPYGGSRLPPNGEQLLALPPTTGQADATRAIEALLQRAEGQWKAGRLTEPRGDNAFESYSRVLDLDPEHTEAKQRLVQIGRINAANRMFSSAEHLLRRGNIEDARRMIEIGLKINPDDERLSGLQRVLDY
jgi:hypothetical protein